MRPDHQRKYRAALYGCITVEGSGASQLPSSGLVCLAPSRSTLHVRVVDDGVFLVDPIAPVGDHLGEVNLVCNAKGKIDV